MANNMSTCSKNIYRLNFIVLTAKLFVSMFCKQYERVSEDREMAAGFERDILDVHTMM